MQKRHWLENVFSGNFNESCMQQVAAIGKAHERIGLEPRWYIGGYCLLVNKLTELALTANRKKPARALAMI